MFFKKKEPKIPPRADSFAKLIGQQFREALSQYNPRVDGIGQGYFFNNYIVVTELDQCMIRFVLDRNDVYVETAPLNTYPILRPRNIKNLWFDVSIVTSLLRDKGENFTWFYPNIQHPNSDASIQEQLSQLDVKLKPFWTGIIDLHTSNYFSSYQDELQKFRDEQAQKSWKLLGWNPAKNRKATHRSVFGHFPEYIEKAGDLGNGNLYFGMEGKIWDTLWVSKSDSFFWAVNKQFVDDAINKRQDEIVLATEVRNPESFYAREIKYIIDKLSM
jgi:hypothetical protein